MYYLGYYWIQIIGNFLFAPTLKVSSPIDVDSSVEPIQYKISGIIYNG